MFFSWTIVSTSLIIIPFWLHRSITEQIILKPEQIIFEDCSTNADFIIDSEKAQQLLERLNNLCQFLDIYDYRRNGELGLLNFFKETYSENDKIDLLRFYEDYSREMKKKEKEQEEKKKAEEEKRKKEQEQNNNSAEIKSDETKTAEEKEKNTEQPENTISPILKELEINRAWIKHKFSIYIKNKLQIMFILQLSYWK